MIRILNKAEAARLVGVDNKTIHHWAAIGKINKYSVKGCKTFKVSEKEVKEAKIISDLGNKCHYCEEDTAIKIDGRYLDICTVCMCKQ